MTTTNAHDGSKLVELRENKHDHIRIAKGRRARSVTPHRLADRDRKLRHGSMALLTRLDKNRSPGWVTLILPYSLRRDCNSPRDRCESELYLIKFGGLTDGGRYQYRQKADWKASCQSSSQRMAHRHPDRQRQLEKERESIVNEVNKKKEQIVKVTPFFSPHPFAGLSRRI